MNSGGFGLVFLFTSNNKNKGKFLISERYLIMGVLFSQRVVTFVIQDRLASAFNFSLGFLR